MTDKQEKILRRVRKMMRLAQDAGASEGERNNAMRMVHATLAKYNIDIKNVEATAAGASTSEEPREFQRTSFLGKPWCFDIAGAIARMYFCEWYYQHSAEQRNAGPSQKADYTFIGRHSNAVTAMEMARFVVEAVNREAFRYQRSVDGKYGEYRAFAQAAAHRIWMRCYKIQQDAQTKGVEDVVVKDEAATKEDETLALSGTIGAGTALVIADLYKTEEEANNQLILRSGITISPGRASTYASGSDARRAGAEFGNKVSLHRQIK